MFLTETAGIQERSNRQSGKRPKRSVWEVDRVKPTDGIGGKVGRIEPRDGIGQVFGRAGADTNSGLNSRRCPSNSPGRNNAGSRDDQCERRGLGDCLEGLGSREDEIVGDRQIDLTGQVLGSE